VAVQFGDFPADFGSRQLWRGAEAVTGRRHLRGPAHRLGCRESLDRPELVGVAPDDSVITLKDVDVQEIFALDWEAP
jgi:hypothetical protein